MFLRKEHPLRSKGKMGNISLLKFDIAVRSWSAMLTVQKSMKLILYVQRPYALTSLSPILVTNFTPNIVPPILMHVLTMSPRPKFW